MRLSECNHVTLALSLLTTTLIWQPASIHAHPHAWIYVGTTFVMAADGHVTAIEQSWGYDNLLTDAILEEMAYEAPGQAPDFERYSAQTIERLRAFDYFLRVTVNGQEVPVGEVTRFQGDLEDDGFRLTFTAPLLQPIDPVHHDITLEVFDPSFYVEILQYPGTPPSVRGAAADHCQLNIEYPEPSEEDFMRALAIDRGESVEPQFGALFAEKVHLRCR